MKAFVGLGNPGANYAFTRHNIGFLVIDAISQSYDLLDFKTKFHALYSQGRIDNRSVFLLKPQTFMNVSGKAVSAFQSFYKLKPEDFCIIHDDLDLEEGKIRLKFGGGHGGHNGLRDLIQKIGPNFWRLKIGIGRPKMASLSSADYVLQNFTTDDETWLVPTLQNICTHLPLLFETDPHKFTSVLMNESINS
jgi:PTH1 family peptidyl-tRNA hydrolase